MTISITRTITTVTAAALMGMTLGGLFGYAAGRFAPGLFEYRVLPLETVDPVATATVFCAAGGVFCGGALGAFAILVQAITEWRPGGKNRRTLVKPDKRQGRERHTPPRIDSPSPVMKLV